jgi:general secretion pathway protein C
MGRIVSWIANAVLGVLCCFLVAQTLLQLVGVALSAIPTAAPRAVASAVPVAARTAKDRQIILERNLFNVSTLVATAPVVTEEEDLEATKLPLKLLGTAAASEPRLSWAAVEDLETRQHLVVRPEDLLKQQAKVVRIERRRIVLENGARREELALDDGDGAGGPAGAVRTSAAGRPGPLPASMATPQPTMPIAPPGADSAAQARVRRLADNRFSVARSDVANLARNPAALFSQARMIPKYDPNGQMQGFQLNAVQPGSFWEQMGIQSGDVVTMFNGQRIDSPESSASVLSQITQARSVNVVVQGSDGRERTLTYEFQE